MQTFSSKTRKPSITPAPRPALQRLALNSRQPASTIPASVGEALRSGGRPLEPTTRTHMESRFGHDFSRVQVHTDAKAAESAAAVRARAYTVGQDVVFGAGEYAPNSAQGQKLLAHELTHAIQQGPAAGGPQTSGLSILGNDRYEREAEASANGITAGQAAPIASGSVAPGIQRWPWPIGDGGKDGGKTEDDNCAG